MTDVLPAAAVDRRRTLFRLLARSAAVCALALATGCAGQTEQASGERGDDVTAREEASGTAAGVDPAGRSGGTAPARATYVGLSTCVDCHAGETARWRGSHHDLAMAPATPDTVRGAFDGRTFSHQGVTSTFLRRGDKFIVQTDGPDGKLADFPVVYTFGVEPLQQYLIRFPDGRLQASALCWDTRSADEGGQRWFHLYPDEPINADHPLHWTGALQNWDHMCAECHSTDVRKLYDVASGRFDTRWSEIDVACEACHGPGSSHLEWARLPDESRPQDSGMAADARAEPGEWVRGEDEDTARRVPARTSQAVVENCGLCHSRRGALAPRRHDRPLADSHRVALLDEDLYYADGQIKDEVYVYGSFLQSKMYREGVVCTDCHDAHGTDLLAGGNSMCLRCHRAETFAVPAHHHHAENSTGARCVECHMPVRTYMVVDPRRDHGFRIPRPELAERIDAPDACSACHTDRARTWVIERYRDWYGDEPQHPWADALHAGHTGAPGADRQLAALVGDEEIPGIVQGTALSLLRQAPGALALGAARRGLDHADPLVRIGALQSLESAPPEERLRHGLSRLADDILTVRLQAAELLADAPTGRLSRPDAAQLEAALAEYRRSQMFNADRAEAHLNLGNLAARRGHADVAEAAYRTALSVNPTFRSTYVNLADLLRALGRDAEGETLLRQGLERAPEDAGLHHALGLLLIRTGRAAAALDSLERAASLLPGQPRYAYVWAVALHDMEGPDRALAVLTETHERHPGDRDVLAALATFSRQAGDGAAARRWAGKLLELTPDDPGVRGLVRQLEQESGAVR